MNKNFLKFAGAVFAAQLALPCMAKIPLDVTAPGSAKCGEKVTVSVKTDPKAKLKIEAQDAGVTQSIKLMDKTADSKGNASWNFDIPKDFKADKMPVTITVSKKGEKAEDKAVKEITIAK